MLKRTMLLGVLIGAILCAQAVAGIVNNNSSTQEDYVLIPFQLLDPSGMPVQAVSADRLSLVIWYPNGTEAYVDSNVTITSSANVSTKTFGIGSHAIGSYVYKADLSSTTADGSSPVSGTYKYTLIAWDASADLYSTFSGEFQLLLSTDLSAIANRVDSLRLESNRVYADAKAVNGDVGAAASIESAFDSDSNSYGGRFEIGQILINTNAAGLGTGNHGLYIKGGTDGVRLEGGTGDGLEIRGGSGSGSGNSIRLVANANGTDLIKGELSGSGTGPQKMIDFQYSGSADNVHGIYINGVNPGTAIDAADGVTLGEISGTPIFGGGLDSSDFSADWKIMVGRTPWYADTNNSAWNGTSTKFGYWNGKASSTTGYFESDEKKTYGVRVRESGAPNRPLPGALVILYDESLSEEPCQGLTDEEGNVSWQLHPNTTYRAVVHKPGYTFPLAVSISSVASTTETTIVGQRDSMSGESFGSRTSMQED